MHVQFTPCAQELSISKWNEKVVHGGINNHVK